MTTAFLNTGHIRSGLKLDSRTKFLILVWGVVLSAFSPGRDYEIILCASVLVLAALSGLFSHSIKTAVFYGAILLVQPLMAEYTNGVITIVSSSFFMLVQKLVPTMVLGGVLILTTRVSEFMFAMAWFRLPGKLAIAFAVMLRYFPGVKQDFSAIKDAMRMRGLFLSLAGFLRSPLMTLECLYVPVMLSASRLADELSAASVARGIENPAKRTCFSINGFGLFDALCILLFCGLTVLVFVIGGGES